jgi:metallo-beta-lactamase family protein
MAEHTLGRRILEQGMDYAQSGRSGTPPLLRFFNKEYPLKAHVVKIGGFSAHADKNEMTRFLRHSNLKIKKIAVIHGEEQQSLSFATHLKDQGFQAFVPQEQETVTI